MGTLAIDISPKVLEWAIRYVELSDMGTSSLELLKKWQIGEKKPTFSQLRDISARINIPFGYFLLQDPPVEHYPLVDFRTVDSMHLNNPSRNLLDTIDSMTEAQTWMIDYVRSNDITPLSYVGALSENDSVSLVVNLIRDVLNLQSDWNSGFKDVPTAYKFIKTRISDSGTMVMQSGIVGSNTRRKLDLEEFRAFTLINEYVPLIFINSVDSETGKIFSVFHEFAHIIVGQNNLYNSWIFDDRENGKLEALCNAAAAELMVPDELFIVKWNTLAENVDEKILSLAKCFKCSRFVIVRKALDNGFVTKQIYKKMIDKFKEELSRISSISTKGGGDYYRNKCSQLDRNLVFALNASIKEGKTQYTEAYRITKTNAKTFDKVLAGYGGK